MQVSGEEGIYPEDLLSGGIGVQALVSIKPEDLRVVFKILIRTVI
jgi:hypothetical protein